MIAQTLKQALRKPFRKASIIGRKISGETVKIEGVRIKTPEISGLICTLTETWMISLLKQLLKKQPGAFLDVGINLGQTLIKVKGLEPDRQYVGFEPNPTCVFYAKELVKKNRFKNCTILPVGLFEQDSLLSLECIRDEEFDSSASLIQGFRPTHKVYRRIPVPVFRFESVAHMVDVDKTAIVKIDVEGAELEVVKSLYQLFETQRPLCLLEVLPVGSAAENPTRQARQTELERLFQDLHYRWFRVVKKGNDTFTGLKEIESIEIHSDLSLCDYVVVPEESVSIVRSMVVEAIKARTRVSVG